MPSDKPERNRDFNLLDEKFISEYKNHLKNYCLKPVDLENKVDVEFLKLHTPPADKTTERCSHIENIVKELSDEFYNKNQKLAYEKIYDFGIKNGLLALITKLTCFIKSMFITKEPVEDLSKKERPSGFGFPTGKNSNER
jgi:FMN-dependent NADH-azoreductase